MPGVKQLPPDSIYVGTVRAGTQFAQLPNGNLIAVHPEERPLLITAEGLKPFELDVCEVSPDCTISMSIGTLK